MRGTSLKKEKVKDLFALADMEKPGDHYVLFRIQRDQFPTGGSAGSSPNHGVQRAETATSRGAGRYCPVIRSRAKR